MSTPVKRLNVNNIKNNISSKGLAPDKLIAYFIMLAVGYFALVISRRTGLGISYWVASIGFPVLFVWYLLFILRYENQPYYQLLAPVINFISFGNKRKIISESSVEIIENGVFFNKSTQTYIGVLRIFPKNIFTLKEDDRILLTQKYATDFLNNIRGKKIELLLRNRTATVSDYKEYFDYYIDLPTDEVSRLSETTREHLKAHLFEVEDELNKGYLKYKELYLEVYVTASTDPEEDSYRISEELTTIQNLLKNIDVNSVELNQLETSVYKEKFILFKSTEELENRHNDEIHPEHETDGNKGFDRIARQKDYVGFLPMPDQAKRVLNNKINAIINPQSTNPILNSVDFNIKDCKINDKYVSFFFLESLPGIIYQEFMFNLCNQEGIDLRVNVVDMSPIAIQNRAKERLATIEQEQREVQERGGMRSRMKDQEYEEIDTYAEQLVQGTEKPFLMQFKVAISDSDRKELQRKTRSFLENVRNFGFDFNLGVFRHHEFIKEAIPTGRINERYSHLLQSSNANYLLPFNFQQIKHNHGIFYGYNYYDLSPVIYNLFSEDSFSMNVIGIMGSGKSATIKNIIWNERIKGFHFVVIDPENEYIDLASGMGDDGEVFKVSRESPINVMGLENYSKESVKDHVESLKSFFHIFTEEHNFGKGAAVGELLISFYNEYALNDSLRKQSINLESFLDFIDKYKNETRFSGLIDNLQVLRKDREYGEYFCGTANFRVTKPLTVFSLKDIENNEQVFNASMIIISNLFLNVARKKDRRRMLVIDEAWKFFANPISCKMLVSFGGMARKWRLGLTCITQNLTDFNSGNGTIKIISNAQTNIIMKQSKASLEYIEDKDYYDLSDNEKSILKQKEAGLGIIHRASEHVPIKFTILPTPWLYSQTTHEEDMELKNKGIY